VQIHNAKASTKLTWALDPVRGPIQQTERVIERATTSAISVPKKGFASCPEGATFEIQPDGTFEVPDDVGAFYTRMPDWHAGPSPFPPLEMVRAAAAQPAPQRPAPQSAPAAAPAAVPAKDAPPPSKA